VPNASTIRRQVAGTQQLTIATLSLATITTTETVFSLSNNGLTLTGGGIIPLSAGNTGLYQGTGQVIWIHAVATAAGCTAGTTFGLELYQVPAANLATVTNATIINDTLANTIATGQVVTLVNTAANLYLDAYVQLDSNGNLSGHFNSGGEDDVTGDATTVLVTGLLGEQDLNFVITVVAAVHAVGTITLNEFSLNLV
jgi:hypothetical protein